MRIATAFTIFLFLKLVLTSGVKPTTKHYIVYMGEHSHPNSDSVISANHDLLATVTGSFDKAQKAAVLHYSKNFRGFSAMLTTEQAQQLAERESVISVFESRNYHLHTTHSWNFLGVDSISQHNELRIQPKADVIVGVIDTGIWPESESFNDKGFGPTVPKRFKGECVVGDSFTLANCNRKLIGARFYYKGFEADHGPLESFNKTFVRSARDADGHGSHTASTVVGSVVNNVSLFGMATGTARGGAPNARLAIYKACWFEICNNADLLSAFDDATNDGVDIISISAGPFPPQLVFTSDAVSIGSFHAFRKGILVSASAGNSGLPSTASNIAPWILTVAASSVDREFTSLLHLGNSKALKGKAINPLTMEKYYELIVASAAAAPGVPARNASFCTNNTLDPTLIKGKIVVCAIEVATDSRIEKSIFVRQAGGVGMVLIDPLGIGVGFQFVIPATQINQKVAEELLTYITTEKHPVAIIHPTTTALHTKPAPKMAVFSSMGPNIITPDIIKPDITAPGVNILAAWSPLAIEATAERSVDYNIYSGTSMACPHVSAVAAIIKSCHQSWSPSAIKSAIMTTATVVDNNHTLIVKDPFGSRTTPFNYGSGHIKPAAALDPGLVYEYNSSDIIDFLCSNGADPAELNNITGKPLTCKNDSRPSYNLNYPSIGISSMNGNVSVIRTVTYLGKSPTVFVAYVEKPEGVNVVVQPHKLKLKKYGEKKCFKVHFMPYRNSNGSFVFGSLTWRNGIHRVRSPIAVNVISVY